MKRLLLSALILSVAPVAQAEAPTYVVKTSANVTSQSPARPADASSVVDLAGHSAIKYLDDGLLSDTEAKALLGFLDVDRVAKFTLGRYGRGLTDQQFDAFRVAFDEYVTHQFQTHLSSFSGADLRIVETVKRRPNDAVVKTEIATQSGDVQKVNWRVIKRNNEWNVVDVEALGFWFAIEQRAQFTAQLDKSGGDIDALIAKISRKN